MRRSTTLALVALIGLSGGAAIGDYNATQGVGTIFKSFTVGGVHQAAMTLTDSAGNESGTAGNPINTSAAQSGTWSVNPTTVGNWGIGAAGSAVPGFASMTGLNVAGNARQATGIATGAHFAQTFALVDSGGVQISSFGGTSSSFSSAFPATGSASGFTDGTNMVPARAGAISNFAAATNFVNVNPGCQYLAAAPTVTDTRYQGIQCDVNGYLRSAVPDGADIGLGATSAAVATVGSAGSVNAKLRLMTSQLDAINSNIQGAIPAGANIIGKVGIDQSTPGTTNAVALTASTAIVGKVGIDQSTPGTTNLVALSAETSKVIGTVRATDASGNNYYADPCQRAAKTYTPISITTATTTRIVAPSASNRTYICYLLLTSAAADNVGIVEGTGGTCGTGTAGVIGGTTSANGPNFAANGGVSIGNGATAVAATAGTNVDLCLITSAATPLAGHIAWVQLP